MVKLFSYTLSPAWDKVSIGEQIILSCLAVRLFVDRGLLGRTGPLVRMEGRQRLPQSIGPFPHTFPGGRFIREITSGVKFKGLFKVVTFPGHIRLRGLGIVGQYDFHIIDSDTVNHAVALAYSIFGQGVPPFKIA